MLNEINLKQWKINFKNGMYDNKDKRTQCDAGWYDWWCKDTSLRNKTYKMGKIISKLNDNENVYVFFKNNCPMEGNLYDSFKICDIENGDVIYCINIDSPYDKARYTLYGKENDFKDALLKTQYSKDLVNFLNTKI